MAYTNKQSKLYEIRYRNIKSNSKKLYSPKIVKGGGMHFAQKKTLLQMHNDIVALCDKHNITIMLGGGSCLGAIRHKGFISWDDDLDLMMPREDYERLVKIYEKGLVDDKFLFVYPNKDTDVKNNFLKIYLKGTTYKDLVDDDEILEDDCEEKILKAYYDKPNAALIAFALIRKDNGKKYPEEKEL